MRFEMSYSGRNASVDKRDFDPSGTLVKTRVSARSFELSVALAAKRSRL